MYTEMMNLVKSASELEKQYVQLKEQGPPIYEVNKQKIIDEYRASSELTEVVLGQFDEGYQHAKAKNKEKIKAAGIDPELLVSLSPFGIDSSRSFRSLRLLVSLHSVRSDFNIVDNHWN